MNRYSVVALLGSIAVVVSAATAAAQQQQCPPRPSYAFAGSSLVDETETNEYGHGLVATDNAQVTLDYMTAGNNPNRIITQTHYACEEFDWVLQAPPNCNYNVLYHHTAHFIGSCHTNVDDAIDDAAQATCSGAIYPGSQTAVGVAISNYVADDDYVDSVLQTSTQSKSCVGNGTLFWCVCYAEAYGGITSEAYAASDMRYEDVTFWESSSLCP